MKKIVFVLILSLVLSLFFGCISSGSNSNTTTPAQFARYINEKEKIAISYPVGWAYNETFNESGSGVCFNPASIKGYACVMQVYISKLSSINQSHWLYEVVGTRTSIAEIKDAYIKSLEPDANNMKVNITKVDKTTLLGKEAYQIEFDASLEGSLQKYESKEIHIISMDDTSFILLKYSYPPKDFDAYEPYFTEFVSSFMR